MRREGGREGEADALSQSQEGGREKYREAAEKRFQRGGIHGTTLCSFYLPQFPLILAPIQAKSVKVAYSMAYFLTFVKFVRSSRLL